MNEWDLLLEEISAKLNRPAALQDVLLLIGVYESGMPAKPVYSSNEHYNLTQMAEQTLLAAAGYYRLFWVEDSGWPHYQLVQHPLQMNDEQKALFLRPWILQYLQKNRLVVQ